MAIKGKFTTLSGIELQEAYANIPKIEIFKQIDLEGNNQFMISAYVTSYATQNAYAEQKNVIEGSNISFILSPKLTEALMAEVYDQLKLSNKIEEAVDC
jgi:hypothetical protein